MPSLPELCSGKILLELADILMKPLGHGGFTVEVASPHPENRLVRGRLPSTAAAMCGRRGRRAADASADHSGLGHKGLCEASLFYAYCMGRRVG